MEEGNLKEYIADQYSQLFASVGVTRLEEVIEKVQPRITQVMNDDSLIMMKANEENANCLQSILDLYEECSGQKINKEQ